jgi:hypothetical protein
MTINDRKRKRERESPMKRRKKTLLDANNCSTQTRAILVGYQEKKITNFVPTRIRNVKI